MELRARWDGPTRTRVEALVPLGPAVPLPRSIAGYVRRREGNPAGFVLAAGAPQWVRERYELWRSTFVIATAVGTADELADIVDAAVALAPDRTGADRLVLDEIAAVPAELTDGPVRLGMHTLVALVARLGELDDALAAGAVRGWELRSPDHRPIPLPDADAVLTTIDDSVLRLVRSWGIELDRPGHRPVNVAAWHSSFAPDPAPGVRRGVVRIDGTDGTPIDVDGDEAFLFEWAAPRRAHITVVRADDRMWQPTLRALSRTIAAAAPRGAPVVLDRAG